MKKIKITEEQAEKLKENLVEPHIDKWIEKGDITALAHHYNKADDAGKTGIIDKAKAHASGGEVFANKISLRARDAKKALEETNGVIDGISGADDEAIDKLVEDAITELVQTGEETIDETTTSASSGQYSSKFFIKKGKPNANLQYPGGQVVKPNTKTHTQGINSTIKEETESVLKELKESYFKAMSLQNNMTSRHDDFAHYVPKKKVNELGQEVDDEFGDEPVQAPADTDTPSMDSEEPAADDSQDMPQFTTNDLMGILDGLKNDVGGDHPVYNHLKEILTHFTDTENPDAPVSPQVIKAFRAALPDSEEDAQAAPEDEVTEYQELGGEDDFDFGDDDFAGLDDMSLDFDDTDTVEPTPEEKAMVANHLKLNQKYGFDKPHMTNEVDGNTSDINIRNHEIFQQLKIDASRKADAKFTEIFQTKSKITNADVFRVAEECGLDFQEARENALDIIQEIRSKYVDETTGSASSGQFSGQLIRRNPAPEDYIFEDTGEEHYIDSKYIDANMTDFTDSEGLLKQAFGVDNVQAYEKSHEGHVVFVRNEGEYEIGLLKNGKFFVKMNDDNYDKYNVFDSLQDIIDAIKSFGSGEENTDMMQEEYSKPSPAMANLKKVHQATENITKSEFKKAGEIVKKGDETSGVQFVGKVADGVENKSIDNTEAQDKVDMIEKGMEDLKYENEPSKIFTKNFENGLKPVVKSAAVTDQFGNKYPEQDHANVVDNDLGDKLQGDVKKKEDLEVPTMDNFVQRVKIVKESDEIVITEEEQEKIDEDVAKMRKLLGYKPENYTSTKGNKIDNSLFNTKK